MSSSPVAGRADIILNVRLYSHIDASSWIGCFELGSRQASYTSHMSRISYNSHGDLLNNGKPVNMRQQQQQPQQQGDYRSRPVKTLVPDLVVEYSKHQRREYVSNSQTHFS